jgi:uncharacterized membrane-anchored protein YjiN (DUF445 family)
MRGRGADARGLTASDAQLARALTRQKVLATGLVVICALVYVGAKAFAPRYPASGYVAAFAEAAIIGALADWYAVVALFRHPLGLKLPHTAIIPKNQTRIAENLGNFIARHFLSGSHLGEKVHALDLAASTGSWIAEPHNRKRIADHAAQLVPDAIAAIDHDMARDAIERGVLARLAAVDFAMVISTSLEVITRANRHHAILEEVLGWLEARLAEPTALAVIRERIRSELPTLFRFFLADAYLLQRLIHASHALLMQVRFDPIHPLRAEFDRLIRELIDKLRISPEGRHKVERLKQELLARAELREMLIEGWHALVASVREDAACENGIIRPGLEAFLSDVAERLQHDENLRAGLNRWLADGASLATERYKNEAAAFIAAQVKAWDTQHAVRTIELSLGSDLQYVRINGTLVGGLLGLLIFTVTRLVLP